MRHEASQGEEGNEKGQTQEKEIRGGISREEKKPLFFS
jgi:hypothetical protein